MSMGEPQPPDDSGGFCCVMAAMHMGHDEDCAGYACPLCQEIVHDDPAIDEFGVCTTCLSRMQADAEPKTLEEEAHK